MKHPLLIAVLTPQAAPETRGLRIMRLVWMALCASLAGAVLGGARALGEFGATLMVAGSIPGRTQTMPLLIYDAVQRRDYGTANLLVLVMTGIAFLSLWAVRRFGSS